MNPTDFLATEDGQTLCRDATMALLGANAERLADEDFEGFLSVADGVRRSLLAILSASKPCPTCGGSGETPQGPLDWLYACPSCHGTGTVPILPIPE